MLSSMDWKIAHHALRVLLVAMQATSRFCHSWCRKLNRNGQQNITKTTADFIERLRDIMACEITFPARRQRGSIERRPLIVSVHAHGSGVMTSQLLIP